MSHTLDLSSATLVSLLRSQSDRFGDRPFLSFFDGTEFSFRLLDELSDALGEWLASVGCEQGDRVVCVADNCPESVVLLFAANKIGAIFVPLNPQLTGVFLEHQLHNAAPKVIFIEDEKVGAFDTVGLPEDTQHVVAIRSGTSRPVESNLQRARLWRYTDIPQSATRSATHRDCRPSDTSTIMYTSGTTGPAKGVLMPHTHCLLFGLGISQRLGLTPDDKYYICLPLFHANGLFMQVIGCLIAGSQAHVARRFSASGWLQDLRDSKATVTHALGVIPEFILAQPPSPTDRDHSVRFVMTVPVSREWATTFEQRFGVKIIQGFGMTECNMIAYTYPDDPLAPGSCGSVLDEFFEVRLVDPETDETVAPGEVGEIAVRPKVPFGFMAGYFRMPDRTVEAWRNLWFHTGDAARLAEDGKMIFVDRIKDCIRRRGENISSYEIEQVVNAHPAVAESAAVGVRVDGAGGEEEVLLCVVVEPGSDLDADTLIDFCRQRLPKYVVPRFVTFVSDLPKTPTGKLQKQRLRESWHAAPEVQNA